MAYRKFIDREGHAWEIVNRSKREWILEPADDNSKPRRAVEPPSYESDPFEMSKEELQQLLDGSGSAFKREGKSPFKD